MILGSLIYCLFALLATVGTFLGVQRLRGSRMAWLSTGLSLLFFVGLYIALDVFVLSPLRDL